MSIAEQNRRASIDETIRLAAQYRKVGESHSEKLLRITECLAAQSEAERKYFEVRERVLRDLDIAIATCRTLAAIFGARE